MGSQLIRRSQYITTYGPGAILEGPGGPRAILNLERSDVFAAPRRTIDYEITELRLSRTLLNGAGIIRVPSNAEVGEPDSVPIYSTESFPRWALCTEHRPHGILYCKRDGSNQACPLCPAHATPYLAWDKVHKQAIRFVRACPDGHLDDVDWVGMIPHARPNCRPRYLEWRGGGGALRNIDILCPDCGQSINLGVAYSRDWTCSGRFPEQGRQGAACGQRAKIIQRGAANLRMAEIQTALTIPPRSTPLHRLLELSIVRASLSGAPVTSKAELMGRLQNLVNDGLLPASVRTAIGTYPEQDILNGIADTIAANAPASVQTLRSEEFGALCHAADHGAPRQPASTPGAPDQFEVVRAHVRQIPGPRGHLLRVVPVNRLRVVMVQTGYRRLDPMHKLVDTVYFDGQRSWYPGVELFGEGIFIDLAPPDHGRDTRHFQMTGAAQRRWREAWVNPGAFGPQAQPDLRYQLHPVFVWWHSFAHRLVNALAVDSGYSSAAVRERVYVEIDERTGDAHGGVLLYTAQPGGDGTLGGLVALVPEFERVIEAALRDIDACSNDPLCCEEAFGPGKYNGAACYACSLISETSCEYRNTRLDRNLLLENLP